MSKAGQYRKGICGIIRICIAAVIIGAVGVHIQQVVISQAGEKEFFRGNGTHENPYQIRNVGELALLAKEVNSGKTFDGIYFVQTVNLDMKDYGNWTPIGTFDSGFAFAGIYDGSGHMISNISINGDKLSHGNAGLFGLLNGIVCNLGIESGTISGDYIGSIASHAGENSASAAIINCYNKATLNGRERCGGIADNFGNGKIICCVNEGELTGPVSGNIVSYTAGKLYGCQGVGSLVNEHFAGNIEECLEGKVDFSLINSKLSKASDLFDLHKLVLKKW